MLNKIEGYYESNQTLAVDNISPLGTTCLKPEALVNNNNEAINIYTQKSQFSGWYYPTRLGVLMESISIGSLYSKISSAFRMPAAEESHSS
ncbi:hypothetical protein SMD22_00930 (plasmid) [Brevibacillus halotolerans]|nr:hypothetical protein SMD22_00930 [Brevibacillus halotolerans]